jgi:hypothetical protein
MALCEWGLDLNVAKSHSVHMVPYQDRGLPHYTRRF